MTLVEALVWIFLLPPLQGPDEIGHVSYTQRLVERQAIPWAPGGGNAGDNEQAIGGSRGGAAGGTPLSYSEELATLETVGNFAPLVANVAARPPWTPVDEAIWRRADASLGEGGREGGLFTAALKNPPAYYLYGALAYAPASGGTIVDRLFAMRLANIPLLLVTVAFTWLAAGRLLRGRRWLQFAATAPVALHPQLLNLTATFNPDMLLVAAYAVGLYLMLLLLERGPEPRLVAGTLAVCTLAALTHYRGVPLFVPGLLAIAIAYGRGRVRRRTVVVAGAAAFALAVIALFAAAGLGAGDPRQFGSYLWQFYLPKLGFMDAQIGPPDWGFREVWIDRFFTTFSHLEVALGPAQTQALFWAAIAGLIALALVLVLGRRALRARSAQFAVLVAAALALLATVHLGAYRGMLGIPDDPVFTGRYLLPLLPLYGVAIALVASRLPSSVGRLLAAAVIGGALVLQAASVGLLLERFYG